MTNTTEEIIRTIRKGFITENRSTVCNEIPFVADAVDYTVERVFALPLADRLTPEEKEQIKKLYCAAKASKSDYGRGYSAAIKRIFGADFFKEGE